jgi:hypothetical protein
MIGPADDRVKDAATDTVTLELTDVDRGACVFVQVALAGDDAGVTALAALTLGGETATIADPASISMETREPLVRWQCRVAGDSLVLDAELEAVSVPVAFDDAQSEAAGFERYEQICRVRGEIEAGGRPARLDGVGRRAHAWGEPAGGRFRSVYAVGAEHAVTLSAVRPRDAAEHGDELVTAHSLRPDTLPERFESARLSTVYDAAGRPRTAGLELYLPGEEYPRRVSGEAIPAPAGAPEAIETACFRWILDGEPAQGGYQMAGT